MCQAPCGLAGETGAAPAVEQARAYDPLLLLSISHANKKTRKIGPLALQAPAQDSEKLIFMTDHKAITAEAIEFIEKVSYNDLPGEALRVGKRCMVDSLGVMIAGCSEHSVHILIEDALDQGG
ncbi:MAG: MmgE/PrpD family protein, partial [Beijerinckiaceae bacterium]|nr:MmgE/PrpD family protein [Beijerinckiaceae bacterium]